MYFLAPINADDHVFHFLIDKIRHFVRHVIGVRRQCKTNVFTVYLLLLPPIFHGLLHNVKIHQRFPAEKIHLEVPAAAGMRNEEINRRHCRIRVHQRARAVVFAGVGKAVRAPEVAVLRNEQAQSFNHGRIKLCIPPVDFAFRIQKPLPYELLDFIKDLPRFLSEVAHNLFVCLARIFKCKHAHCGFIDCMYRAGLHVQRRILPAKFY
ncbi:MAG: hypothetical protein DELT_03051 [Desulfovibrio sp.]